MEFAKILIFITVDIFKDTAKKIRKLNEQIKFYLKCMVPPYFIFTYASFDKVVISDVLHGITTCIMKKQRKKQHIYLQASTATVVCDLINAFLKMVQPYEL